MKITDAEIHTLRDLAVMAGDVVTVLICDGALGDSRWSDEEWCRSECQRVIDNARAQGDGGPS